MPCGTFCAAKPAMIIKFAKPGTSFKGVMQYLAHDPDHAVTSERLAWTHTLNLAHDEVDAAVAEMRTTALNADVLKAEHGIGGRAVEKPVRHISLNWHPSETPDRAAMIDAAQSFLKHMGWDEHQAVLIAHDDKAYRHVHLVVNAIHPETGRKLDDGYERRRAQAWGLAYEQEQGRIFCEERLKPIPEREASIPRDSWMLIRETALDGFGDDDLSTRENRKIVEQREWQILKELQRAERIAFFENGREIYRAINTAIYREVREEFRPEWASYYAARRDGLDANSLAELRAELIARQREVLEERRTDAIAERRELRDIAYRDLLDRQKDERGDLVDRQELGLRSHELLDRAYPVQQTEGIGSRTQGEDVADILDRFGIQRGRGPAQDRDAEIPAQPKSEEIAAASAGAVEREPLRDPVSGIAGGLLGLLGHLGDSLLGGHSKALPKAAPEPDALDRFKIQRGQSPPGDAGERAEHDRQQAHEERRAWRRWHQYEQER